MTADLRLRRVRVLLAGVVVLTAVTWAVALGGGLLLVAGVADLGFGLARSVREATAVGSVALGAAVAAAILWRSRGVASLDAVALWLEARAPAMHFALITLVEGRHPSVSPRLEEAVAEVNWAAALRQSLLRAVAVPLLAALLVVAGLAALPRAILARAFAPEPGDVLSQPIARVETHDPLRPIVVTLTPPAYSGVQPQTLEDPETITGLAGTAVRVMGRGAPGGLTATLGGHPILVGASGDQWVVRFALPDSVRGLRLAAGGTDRVLVIDGTPDSMPVVRLAAPLRDTVWSMPRGSLALHAVVHDDYGLAEGWFEYVVTTGSGERFVFRTGVAGRRPFNGARDGALDGVLLLDSLQLVPGDVVHMRAAARDRNIVTGPDTGYSDTRTIRVPRPGEGDSVSVEAAGPADADSSLLSERMLILQAEALQRRRPRMKPEAVLRESQGISRDQAALRRQVAGVIFHRLGGDASAEESNAPDPAALTPDDLLAAADKATDQSGDALDFAEDETPVVAINRPLLEAYNAMWAAGRALDQGDPGRALPPMREALAAIMRAREAERIYLRGRPPVAVVDLSRVRLAGKLAGVRPSPAHGAPYEAGSVAALLTRFTRAVDALPAPAALDSLTILRIDARRTQPGFAAALDQAVAALRSGQDATGALVQARRALGAAPAAVATLPAWGWP